MQRMAEEKMKLLGRHALVTGAATGIGKATAELLASWGAEVVIHHHPDQGSDAADLVEQIRAQGGRAVSIGADLAKREDVAGLVHRVLDRVGHVEIFVSNAAVFPKGAFTDMTLSEWDEMLAVNVTATFVLARDIVLQMITNQISGRIVIVSSYNALWSAPGMAAYASSKAAISMLGRGIAREVATEGIVVNMVAPAAIGTSNNTQWNERSDDGQSLEWFVPQGRLGTPADVAKAIGFLCSEDAQFITGATLAVDGGVTTSKR